MRTRFEIDPPRAWYYCIFLNSRTMVILLQIDLTFGDELEIIREGFTRLKTPLSSHGL